MKKPINKFAVVLWVLAVVILACDLVQVVTLFSTVRNVMPLPAQNQTFYIVWRSLGASLGAPAQVAAMGVIIELIDQIRWNALSKLR